MFNRLTSGLIAIAGLAVLAPTLAADTQEIQSSADILNNQTTAGTGIAPGLNQQWRFRVMLGKREIGFHEFRVNQQGDETEVEINADFDVKILFINAYSYSHQNEELWQGNCLTRLESITDDNGEANTVLGMIDDNAFVVRTPTVQYEEEVSCIRSFAYWNPAFLDSERLLNSQTGEIVDVQISSLGQEAIEIEGRLVSASRYAVEMDDGTISLWYSSDNGQWLALEAPTPGGRVLRYQPVELPFQVTTDEKLALK